MASQKRYHLIFNMSRYHFWLILLFLEFISSSVSAQDFPTPFPLAENAYQKDTMDDFYRTHHIKFKVDSTFYMDELLSVRTFEINKEGVILNYTFSHSFDSGLVSHVKKIKVDQSGFITEYISFTCHGKDTSSFVHKKLISKNKEGNAELIWFSEYLSDTSQPQKFKLPLLGYRYIKTQSNIYWHSSYVTDNYVKFQWDKKGELISSDQLAFHKGDTLYRQRLLYSSDSSLAKVGTEQWVYTDNKPTSYSKHDKYFQITESISFIDGKETEHHIYENKYDSDTNLVDVVVYDFLSGNKVREMEIKIDSLELLIIPEVGFETHDHIKFNPYWNKGYNIWDLENQSSDNHTEADSPLQPFVKTKAISGGYWSVEYFVSRKELFPYKTVWVDNRGLPVLIYLQGQIVEKISYEIDASR